MVDALSTSTSGLLQQAARIQESAARLANLNTSSFSQNSSTLDFSQTAVQPISLIEELVTIEQASLLYSANASVFSTISELEDEVLNLFDEEI